MRKLLLFIVILYATCNESCLGTAYDKKIVDGYYLTADDALNEMQIVIVDTNDYMFSVVPATVVAIENDEQYIYAAVENKGTSSAQTSYYIVPIVRSPSEYISKDVIGPLGEKEFYDTTKRMRKNISWKGLPSK